MGSVVGEKILRAAQILREEQIAHPILLGNRETILAAVDTYELVEAYPDDKDLPSYLLLGRQGSEAFHMLCAADVEGDNIRVVTAYRPDAGEWQADLKTRRPRR